MARVPYLTEKELAAQNRDLLTRNLNLYRALVNSPDTARSFMALGMHIRFHMKLDPRLRELAILQVGYRTRAPYEYAHHIELGRQFGVSDDDLAAIAQETRGETSALPALDRAVLGAARELTDGTQLSDETFAALRAGPGKLQQPVDFLKDLRGLALGVLVDVVGNDAGSVHHAVGLDDLGINLGRLVAGDGHMRNLRW